MTKWLNNIWLANQVAQYMKEIPIQTRQNGAKTVEIVQEYPHLLDTPGMVGSFFLTKTLDLNLNLFSVIN